MPQSDISRIINIVSQNADKDFVKRIINKDDYPELDNEDGSVSTHSMAAEVTEDGNWVVFPTVDWDDKGKTLKRYDLNQAMDKSLKNSNYIDFGADKESAIWFSKNYKKLWNRRK